MPNMWQYESILLHKAGADGKNAAPAPEEVKETLNRYGKLGYQIIHVKERPDGSLFTILARDTGRPIDEGEDRTEDWLVDAVTSNAGGFGDG